MINVSKPAQEQIRMYFEGKEIAPIRIFLNSAGCGGPSLAMALDEKKETDAVFTFDDVEYIMDKDLVITSYSIHYTKLYDLNTIPFPCLLETFILPLCAFTILFTIDSPSPVPESFVVK